MGILTEQLADVPHIRRIVALQIDSVELTASATVREGVLIDGALIPVTSDIRLVIAPQVAAAQLTVPIGQVAQMAGLTEQQLLGATFVELMTVLFDAPA